MEARDVYPSDRRMQFVEVSDASGNIYVCEVSSLKETGRSTKEEFRNCINSSAVPQPFAGG